MSIGKLVHFDSQGFTRRLESWCLYAAFASPADGKALVKVGISQSPLRRIYNVHLGSAYPIEAALWTHVGNKRQGLQIERTVRARLEERRTRGEWYEFDTRDPEQKALFHSVCKIAFMRATGRKLEWRKTNIEQAKVAVGINFNEGLTRPKK